MHTSLPPDFAAQRKELDETLTTLGDIESQRASTSDAGVTAALQRGLELCEQALTDRVQSPYPTLIAAKILSVLDFDQQDPLYSAVQAHLLFKAGHHDQAFEAAHRARELDPDNPRRIRQVADMYDQLFMTPESPPDLHNGYNKFVALKQLAELDPTNSSTWQEMIEHMQYIEMHGSSIYEAKEWLKNDPDNSTAHHYLAIAQASLGDQHEASTSWRRARELNPECGIYWRAAIEHCPIAAAEINIAELEDLAKKAANPIDQCEFLFAIGHYYDTQQEWDLAFTNFLQAQEAACRLFYDAPYDFARTARDLATIKKGWPIEGGPPQANILTPTQIPRPIFVMGAPRSGTTLVQHILATHQNQEGDFDVFPSGEIIQMSLVMQLLKHRQQHPFSDPEEQRMLPAAAHVGYQKSVVNQFQLDKYNGLRYFVDKLPFNLRQIEIMLQLFPDSPIIHCKRNALDIAVSAIKRNFLGQPHLQPYCDLKTFGQYFRDYHRPFVEHWLKLVQPGRILDLSYEKLVKNPAAAIPSLLEYCDLPWSNSCASAHMYQIPNATENRVYRPIYTSSIDSWKRYEKFLDPLRQFVGDGEW